MKKSKQIFYQLFYPFFILTFRRSRFGSFPDYLVIQLRKFTVGEDWVPKKLGKRMLLKYGSIKLQVNNLGSIFLFFFFFFSLSWKKKKMGRFNGNLRETGPEKQRKWFAGNANRREKEWPSNFLWPRNITIDLIDFCNAWWHRVCYSPVSYTHLTLPTILLV